jgi:GTP-binding protein Era
MLHRAATPPIARVSRFCARARRLHTQTLRPATEAATDFAHTPFEQPQAPRQLKCCLVGPTNAGKSTLLNALAESPVSIISDKIHTTRANTSSFVTDTEFGAQVEVVDAPGALGPTVPVLHREMWDAVQRAQLTLVVVDAATRPSKRLGGFLHELEERLVASEAAHGRRSKTALVLNKVDLVRPKRRLLALSEELHRAHRFDWPCFMVSAKSGSGVEHLRGWLTLQSQPGAWSVPPETKHVQPPLQVASEIIRAEIFRCFKQELPNVLAQRNLGWTELPNGDLRIDQEILVPAKRRSTMQIVQNQLPRMGAAARRQLTEAMGRRVHLFLSAASVAHSNPVVGEI